MPFAMRKTVQVLAITLLALASFTALHAQIFTASPSFDALTAVPAHSGYMDGAYSFRLTPGAPMAATPGVRFAAYTDGIYNFPLTPGAPAAAVPGIGFTVTPLHYQRDGEGMASHSKLFPHYELFLGYSNFRNLPLGREDNRIAWLSGGSASIAFNWNRYFGLVVDFGGYHDTRFGPNAAPLGGVVLATGNVYSIMTGPRVSFRNGRFTPFIQGLFGDMDATKVRLTNCIGFGCTPLPSQSSYTWSVGGGLDITISHHIAFRLFQADYAMTHFPDPAQVNGPDVWQHDLRLSTGIVFRFGWNHAAVAVASTPAPVVVVPRPRPDRPPTMTCSVYPSTITAGDIATITAVASSPEGSDLTYSWTASHGAITGTTATVGYDSTGVPPGDYRVRGRVVDVRGGSADCSVPITVVAMVIPPVAVLKATLALHSIYFPTGQPQLDEPSTDLAVSQRAILRTLARNFKIYLQSMPDASLTLEGHADVRGSMAYNQRLALRRVAAVKAYLVAKGVPAGKISTRSFGKTEQLNASEVRRQMQANPNLSNAERDRLFANLPSIILAQNRRVDIVLNGLNGSGQKSLRRYPFNAKDALSLLSDTELLH